MVQEITTDSWGSRILSSLMGVLIGFGLIAGSFFLIFWNEGNQLHTAQSLDQAEKALITIPNQPIDKNNDNKVIYFTGDMTVAEPLQDSLLGISTKAIKLERNVKMYQWEEDVQEKKEKQLGGSERHVRTYSYHRIWSSKLIDSSAFKETEGHINPTIMPISSTVQYAKQVKVGDFTLPQNLLEKAGGETIVDLSKLNFGALETRLRKPVKQDNNVLFVGKSMETPEVGDLKITATEIQPQPVSIIAQQANNTLQPYLAPAGKTVYLLAMGQVSPKQMILDEKASNTMMAWILRIASLLMMAIGISLLLKPMAVFADVIPFLGNIVGIGTGVVAFIGGLILWSIATGIAWFVVRPLWAVGLIGGALILGYVIYSLKAKKNLPVKTSS